MNRARPFRLTMWRLGCLVLAWYALVLQGVLLAPAAAARGLDPLVSAALCLDAGLAHQTPGAPVKHGSCDCISHCAGHAPVAPLASSAGIEVFAGQHIHAAGPSASQPLSGMWRTSPPVRGPPAVACV